MSNETARQIGNALFAPMSGIHGAVRGVAWQALVNPMGFIHSMLPGPDGSVFVGARTSAASLKIPRWAKIIDSGGENPVRYAWEEQTFQALLTPGAASRIGFAETPGGMKGKVDLNPIVEPNGTTLEVDDYVLIRAEYFDPLYDTVFSVVGGGGGGSGGTITSDVEFIRIKDATANGDGTFNARIVSFNADGTVNTETTTIWGRDVNGLTLLNDEAHYLARKTSNSFNGRPVYTLEDFSLTVARDDLTQSQSNILSLTFGPTVPVPRQTITLLSPRTAKVVDRELDIVDLFSGANYADVYTLQFDSTPTAYDSTKGDFVFTWDSTNHILTVRLNGHTGTQRYIELCQSGNLLGRNNDFRNGLLKIIGPRS